MDAAYGRDGRAFNLVICPACPATPGRTAVATARPILQKEAFVPRFKNISREGSVRSVWLTNVEGSEETDVVLHQLNTDGIPVLMSARLLFQEGTTAVQT